MLVTSFYVHYKYKNTVSIFYKKYLHIKKSCFNFVTGNQYTLTVLLEYTRTSQTNLRCKCKSQTNSKLETVLVKVLTAEASS